MDKVIIMFFIFFKNKIILLFILFSTQFYAREYTISEIDKLQNIESKRLKKIGDHRASVLLDQELVDISKKIGYKKGIIQGYLNIANTFCTLNQYEQSLSYLFAIEDEEINDLVLKSTFYNELGRNYSHLGLYKQSNAYFDKAIKYANQVNVKKKRDVLLYFAYAWKLGSFEELQINDSVQSMQKKCLSLSPEPLLFITIADRYLKNKKLDSAEYYVKKASLLINKYPIFQKSIMLQFFGKLYSEKKDYKKSLDFYLQSLSISEKMDRKKDMRDTYKLIYKTYYALGDNRKKEIYLEKYLNINDELVNLEKKAVNIPLEKVIHEKQKIEEGKKNGLYGGIGGFLFFVTLIVFFKKIYREQNISLLAVPQNIENLQRNNVGISLSELKAMAMNNDSLFMVRFEEFHPTFCHNLRSELPQLTAKDLKFCALIKLNFSNKEIAQYDHLSIRTVESKKYRLRKKLDLAPDIDFNRWIKGREYLE
ncbi:hypothetical protein MP478_00975 [Chryseobacterium sp. WG14]|uniref:tetratricopeptide repeat protein n=1 Tax=unclassified Chryseobacterium TaxID=2593645 RepID=UPI00211DE167|nr:MULTISPECIES: hypothetical protein [unclassified Chryseobacterium]MCQ9635666.1 hypothetical protein [Chryseobacterium sp. WG23]MCQ9637943.1 hypothetical protein [Chryseobacterium sp. WG14]